MIDTKGRIYNKLTDKDKLYMKLNGIRINCISCRIKGNYPPHVFFKCIHSKYIRLEENCLNTLCKYWELKK